MNVKVKTNAGNINMNVEKKISFESEDDKEEYKEDDKNKETMKNEEKLMKNG